VLSDMGVNVDFGKAEAAAYHAYAANPLPVKVVAKAA